MEIYNIITAICMALLTFEVIFILISYLVRDRVGRIAYLRSFKKGKCALIYFIAIPLFLIGHLYAGQNGLEAFFNAIDQSVVLVVLRYSTSSISALMQANSFYRIVIYYCFTLVGMNAILFTFSLFGQRMWQAFGRIKSYFSHKNKLYIFGYNDNNINIYLSEQDMDKVIVAKLSSEEKNNLYFKKINYVSEYKYEKIIDEIFKRLNKSNKIAAIINSENDENNILLCKDFITRLDKFKNKYCNILPLDKLRIYIFGDPKFETIYNELMMNGLGCVVYKNKYIMEAVNFVDKYPFTRFMDERFIDYKTALAKKESEINVCMIGFGNMNKQLFLTSVANNQFLTENEQGIVLKKVNYHIFDKEIFGNNKNLNHTYYRFKNECSDERDYLPLPEIPADEKYYNTDFNSPEFYKEIKSIISCKNSINFIIIAFGTDLENIDMAQKLAEKRDEWDIKDAIIFVKSRREKYLFRQVNCFIIGYEKEEVYNYRQITNDNIYVMAQKRNGIYDLEHTIAHNPSAVIDQKLVDECRHNAEVKWYLKKLQLERESSLYACLSIRFKLNLIGLDYVKDDGRQKLSEEEYFAVYAKNDPPEYIKGGPNLLGKKIVKYNTDYKPSLRTTLAIQEHYRWNSFMICKGMIPSTKKQILEETIEQNGKIEYTNGKNYALRRHGNITTYAGLIEFRKMIARRDGTTEKENDVIKYDYQLMDDAYWLLTQCGYKIIKK